MKHALVRVTDPIVKFGGLMAGLVYLPQMWNIIRHPEVAVGISLVTFGFLNILQLATAVNCYLKGNMPMAQGMAFAFMGSMSVTLATIFERIFRIFL